MSIKIKREENWINIKTGKYKCPYCGKEYSKMGICSHIWKVHTEEGRKQKPTLGKKGWNRGLTKDSDERVARGGLLYKERCKNGDIIPPWTGKKLPDDTKRKISFSMKKAHKEGRAWNIGKSRWNNDASYPEKFFMLVIQNEFDDKEYIREYSLSIYSLDFAWEHKKSVLRLMGNNIKDLKNIEKEIREKIYV